MAVSKDSLFIQPQPMDLAGLPLPPGTRTTLDLTSSQATPVARPRSQTRPQPRLAPSPPPEPAAPPPPPIELQAPLYRQPRAGATINGKRVDDLLLTAQVTSNSYLQADIFRMTLVMP